MSRTPTPSAFFDEKAWSSAFLAYGLTYATHAAVMATIETITAQAGPIGLLVLIADILVKTAITAVIASLVAVPLAIALLAVLERLFRAWILPYAMCFAALSITPVVALALYLETPITDFGSTMLYIGGVSFAFSALFLAVYRRRSR